MVAYRLFRTKFIRNMEEQGILSCDNVGNPVAVVGNGTKAAPRGNAIWMDAEVQLVGLAVRRLRGGQTPRLAEYLLQERRVHLQVLRHHVQAEQVPVDALATHGVLIADLVLLAGCLQQIDALLCTGVHVVHGYDPRGRFNGAGPHGLRTPLSE